MKTSHEDIREFMRRRVAELKAMAIARLSEIGQMCVDDARLQGSYTDRTGNLRGSIGYVVVDNGTIVASSAFPAVKGGSEGPVQGRRYAESLARGINGLALIIVAGMNYAAYVADRGYNVLDSAEMLAESLLSQLGAR